VRTAGTTTKNSGLEGLTVMPNTDLILANEKVAEYPGDISGVEWDDELQLLWVLSDQAERYGTDIYERTSGCLDGAS
jgi:uncharacterized protein YjiK